MREMRELVLELQDQVRAQQGQIDEQQTTMQDAGLEDERGSKSALSSFLDSTDFSGWVAASYFYNTNNPSRSNGPAGGREPVLEPVPSGSQHVPARRGVVQHGAGGDQ